MQIRRVLAGVCSSSALLLSLRGSPSSPAQQHRTQLMRSRRRRRHNPSIGSTVDIPCSWLDRSARRRYVDCGQVGGHAGADRHCRSTWESNHFIKGQSDDLRSVHDHRRHASADVAGDGILRARRRASRRPLRDGVDAAGARARQQAAAARPYRFPWDNVQLHRSPGRRQGVACDCAAPGHLRRVRRGQGKSAAPRQPERSNRNDKIAPPRSAQDRPAAT